MIHLGTDFRERPRRIVVELQSGLDGGESLRAEGFDIVDAVRRGDDPLQWGGDEASHEVCVCSDVNRRHSDNGIFRSRVLTDVERADGLESADQDHQRDHDGQNRSAYEDVGELHGR